MIKFKSDWWSEEEFMRRTVVYSYDGVDWYDIFDEMTEELSVTLSEYLNQKFSDRTDLFPEYIKD